MSSREGYVGTRGNGDVNNDRIQGGKKEAQGNETDTSRNGGEVAACAKRLHLVGIFSICASDSYRDKKKVIILKLTILIKSANLNSF